MRVKPQFGALYIDYSDELYQNAALRVLDTLKVKHRMAKSPVPLDVAIDAFYVHMESFENLIFRSRLTAWGKIVYQYYLTEQYRSLNYLTASNPLLSRLAAISLIETVYRFSDPERLRRMRGSERERRAYEQLADAVSEELGRLDRQMQSGPQTPASGQQLGGGGSGDESSEGEEFSTGFSALMNVLGRPEGAHFAHFIVSACANAAEQLVTFCQLMEALDSGSLSMSGMPQSGWTHDAAPALEFLENPDEIRKVIANQTVVQFVNVYRAVLKSTDFFSLRRRGSTSMLGLPAAVRKMASLTEVMHLVPAEHAYDDDVMAYRMASRTATVYDRVLPSERVVVYLDKSGSMADTVAVAGIPGIKSAPKISAACGIALALLKNARKTRHSISLRFFDVEVHPQVRHPLEIIRMLMTIRAGSGTNITNVLQEVLGQQDAVRNVVVTDGIDEVDEEVAEEASRGRNIEFIFIQTRNAVIERHFRTHRLSTFDATQVMKIVLGAGR